MCITSMDIDWLKAQKATVAVRSSLIQIFPFFQKKKKFETFQTISASKGEKVWKSKSFENLRILKI